LLEQDADELVGILGITANEIIDRFPRLVAQFLEDDYGESYEGEDVDIS
jgi:hypothetical protein